MPSEALSAVKIGQRACTRAGLPRITSFQDNTAAAAVLEDNYDSVVDEALASHPWHFCTVQVDLNRLTDEPPAPWANWYQAPAAMLALRKLFIDSIQVRDWGMFDNGQLACDAGDTSTVTIEYTYRCDEAQFHPVFVEFIVYRLAELLATGVARDADRGKLFATQAVRYERKARWAASKERTPDRIRAKNLIGYR